jgi:hypothetical protein
MLYPAQALTAAQQDRLYALIRALRILAEPCGVMHAYWHDIFDLEARLRGQDTLLPGPVDARIAAVERLLARLRHSK